MARRKLTPEEEAKLVAEVEAHRGDRTYWDFEHPRRIVIPDEATAVLSVRLPISEVRALRSRAEHARTSLSQVLKEAVETYVANTGPEVTKTPLPSGEWEFGISYTRPRSGQLGAAEISSGTAGFLRPESGSDEGFVGANV